MHASQQFVLIYGLVEEVICAAQDSGDAVGSLSKLVSNTTGIKRVSGLDLIARQISNPVGRGITTSSNARSIESLSTALVLAGRLLRTRPGSPLRSTARRAPRGCLRYHRQQGWFQDGLAGADIIPPDDYLDRTEGIVHVNCRRWIRESVPAPDSYQSSRDAYAEYRRFGDASCPLPPRFR